MATTRSPTPPPARTTRTASNTLVTTNSDTYSVISDHSAVFTTRVNRSAKGYAGANALVVRRMSVCIRATTVLVPEPDDNTDFAT